MRKLSPVLLLVSLLTASACAPAPPSQPPVILIVLDTVRADHMSLYGYDRPTTPRLEEIASSGSVFEWAFSTGAWTLPGVSSILTGRLPAGHGAGRHPTKKHTFTRIRESVPTVAGLLSEAGYTTAAIANGGYLSPGFRMDRGFERYDFHPATDMAIRRADTSVDIALEWIDEWDRDEPFFLMLHLFDAHRHYDAPEPARGTFTDRFADRYENMDSLESRLQAEGAGDLEFHMAAYDEEILWLDREVARFVEALRERGIWDRSLVALTADHGEAFREHGVLAHGASLFNEVLRVPMILWGPEIPGRRWKGPVSTVDIVPTLLDRVGVEAPPELPGISLYGLFEDGELPRRLLFAENDLMVADHVAVISWPLKLIHDFDNEISLLFDMERDPEERVDLTANPDRATRRAVRELRRQARELHRGQVGQEAELDPELVEELRALGYIQ